MAVSAGTGAAGAGGQGGELMAENVFCAHCDTLITDRSSVVELEGKTFCCNNCRTAFMRAQEAPDEVRAAR
jgi:hypothetical protein